jgi:hypothetical protein
MQGKAKLTLDSSPVQSVEDMHWPLQEKRKAEIDPVRFLFPATLY